MALPFHLPLDLGTASGVFTLLFHVSNLLAFLSFLLRDQLHLRLLMALSLALQALYYFAIPAGPLWDPLFWKVVSFLANAVMIVLVFGGRLDFGIPADLRPLYERLCVLSPGNFRKMAAITRRTAGSGQVILQEGGVPSALHYLLAGQARVEKQGQSAMLQAGTFLGEIAFLNGTPASATVVLLDGAQCATWDAAQLHKLMEAVPAIDIAMRGVFNRDLAVKVARSLPLSVG